MIQEDHTKKLMQNYKKTDLNFFKDIFSQFDKTKNNFQVDKNVPHNYNHVMENNSKSYVYELGYKQAYLILTTDEYVKKIGYIDTNFFFDKKYSTIYPKSCIIGSEPDRNFTKKMKKIGDISFEEETNESELVKNMKRLPPDNLTEEWVKTNLNSSVELLSLENCYWLSKSLISKIGRMDPNLKELSLRNLEIDNTILTTILRYANK